MNFLLIILFAFAGALLGTLTGLTPGIHVNNIAIIAIYLYTTGMDPLLLSSLVVGTMIAHTFFDFIPSTYLGAPEAGTAMSVLPMHRLLLSGEGYRAVYLSTMGSAMAMLLSLPLIALYAAIFYILPFRTFQYLIPVILVAIILYLLGVEGKKHIKKVFAAAYMFLISGIFGLLALNIPRNLNFVPLNIGTSFLFPVFTGLFGIPILLKSTGTSVPEQRCSRVKMNGEYLKSSLYGTLSGSLVGFLPGVSSGVATVIAKAFFREDTEHYITALGSVNTANAMLNLAALFIIAHPRSEAVNVIGQMLTLPPPAGRFVNPVFWLLLIAGFVSATYSIPGTLLAAKAFSRIMRGVGEGYRKLSITLIITLLIMIFLLTGPLGLALGLAATLIGLLPPKLGVMRVHLMGVVILPVLLFYI